MVLKKGVDGDALYSKLCPSVSIGIAPGGGHVEHDANDASDSVQGKPSWPPTLLNCTTRFNTLINGFAGACRATAPSAVPMDGHRRCTWAPRVHM